MGCQGHHFKIKAGPGNPPQTAAKKRGGIPHIPLLPGGSLKTNAIAACDVDMDNHTDIIVGNINNQLMQLLMNDGTGTFNEAIDLPGVSHTVHMIRVGD